MIDVKKKQTTYASAGVDISKAEQVLRLIKPHCAKTLDEHVFAGIGPFASIVDIQTIAASMGMGRSWFQASSIDGPGTVTLVAEMMREQGGGVSGYKALGKSVARHCFSDLACGNARPYAVKDNIDSTDMEPEIYEAIVEGMAMACLGHNPAVRIVGGESAQLPGLIMPGQTSFCVAADGLVDAREQLYPQDTIIPGQLVIGISSYGIHLNGWSLVRKIAFETCKIGVFEEIPGLKMSVAHQVLASQPDYNWLMHRILRYQPSAMMGHICAMSHITGGGLYDNIKRNLPDGCRVVIDSKSWTVPPIFRWLIEADNVPLTDAYRTWNMGIGFAVIVDNKEDAKDICFRVRRYFKLGARIIGRVAEGECGVTITGVG